MIVLVMDRVSGLIDLGGPVIAVLMIMSVLALAVTVWKAIVFEAQGIGRNLQRGFSADLLGQVALNRHSAEALRQRLLAQYEEALGNTSAGLRVLDLTSQIAPLLGLFGTVLGMIAAFQTLQEAGSSADPAILAGGIWVALMTTAAGLVVAIPASVLLGWFDSRLEKHDLMLRNALEAALAPEIGAKGALPESALAHA